MGKIEYGYSVNLKRTLLMNNVLLLRQPPVRTQGIIHS